MPNSRILIVGSGPSAFAAAEMISGKGLNIEVYDAGLEYNTSKTSDSKNSVGTVRKLIFGFDFPYKAFSKGPIIDLGNTMASQSFALGGFSNVWGATMLPYTELDLQTWPINVSELQEYYDFISERIPIAANEDSLTKKYPLPKRYSPGLKLSPRIEKLLLDFQHRGNSGFLGRSRLAVQNSIGGKACIYCGNCVTGCDFALIWNSNSYWYSLQKNQKYFPDRRVLRLFKRDNLNFVDYLDSSGSISQEGPFDLVFLGTGPLETFRILHESGIIPNRATLQDSQILFAPIYIGGKKHKNPEHALSQLFLRIESGPRYPINVQLYEYSKEIISRIHKLLPFTRLIPSIVLDLILSKFIFSLIYLDSRDSDQIALNFKAAGSLELHTIVSSNPGKGIALKAFKKWCRKNDLYFSRFLTKKGKAGEGVHYGGTVPFGSEVKVDGELLGFSKLYIIDSSTFNSIPAGPITFTIMANAARIADLATS